MATTPRVLYEKKDFNARLIVCAIFSLVALVVVSLVVVSWVFDVYGVLSGPGPAVSPLANPRQLPPAPRLQISSESDLAAMHAREDSVLYSYGWVDRKSGVVRIPIGRAMDLLVQKGLPSRPPSPGLNPWAVPGSAGFEGAEGEPIPGVPTVIGTVTGPVTGQGTQAVGPPSTLENVGAPAKAQERQR